MCRNGRCGEPCSGNEDCRTGEICRDNICVDGCTDDSRCMGGAVCRDGECNPRCEDDTQCPAGRRCTKGMCQPPFCGDGVIEGGEQCEPNRGVQPACALTEGQVTCGPNCTWQLLPLCQTPSRAFSLPSLPPFSCGDGVLGQGEECDDGNLRDGDRCTASCLMEFGSCGDGQIQTLLNEQCEPSVQGPLPCRADCRYLLLHCGDGKTDPGESCDLGRDNSDVPGATCRADCSLARCGDRIVDGTEQCDDGNRVSGDGCSQTCRLERAAGTEVLPAMVVDLPLLAQQQGYGQYAGQIAGTILCNVPADCPGGSVCAAGICAATPVRAPAGDTGPAAAVLLGAAGACAGLAWVRRKRA